MYCRNNPLTIIDPTGLDAADAEDFYKGLGDGSISAEDSQAAYDNIVHGADNGYNDTGNGSGNSGSSSGSGYSGSNTPSEEDKLQELVDGIDPLTGEAYPELKAYEEATVGDIIKSGVAGVLYSIEGVWLGITGIIDDPSQLKNLLDPHSYKMSIDSTINDLKYGDARLKAQTVGSLIPDIVLTAYGIKKGLSATSLIDDVADDLPKVVIDSNKYPESAKHAIDAQAAGQPSVLTIDRTGASANRAQSLKGLQKVAGKQLDEYPPAMFREGGQGASVRPINPSDNMGSGASMGNQLRKYPNGTRIQFLID